MRSIGSRGDNDDVIVRMAAALNTISHDNIRSIYQLCGYM